MRHGHSATIPTLALGALATLLSAGACRRPDSPVSTPPTGGAVEARAAAPDRPEVAAPSPALAPAQGGASAPATAPTDGGPAAPSAPAPIGATAEDFPEPSAAARRHTLRVEMEGAAIGHVRVIDDRDGERFVTTSLMDITLARGLARVTLGTRSRFVETADAKPVRFVFEQDQGGSKLLYRGRLEGEFLKLDGFTLGGEEHQDVYWEPGWLTPKATERLRAQKGWKAGTRYEFLAYAPDIDVTRAVPMTSEVVGDEVVDVGGKPRTLHHVRSVVTVGAGSFTIEEWANDAGTPLVSVMPLGAFTMKVVYESGPEL